MTRLWGLKVGCVELAVESMLQPPQNSPAGPARTVPSSSWFSTSWGGACPQWQKVTLPPGLGEEPPENSGGKAQQSTQLGVQHRLSFATCSLNQSTFVQSIPCPSFRSL